MTFREIKQKPIEYIILFLVFLTGAISFFIFRSDTDAKRRIILSVATAYFLWSLFHHYKKGDLHLSIIVEYLVFILFAIVLILTTFF